jgi:hypothetical protein
MRLSPQPRARRPQARLGHLYAEGVAGCRAELSAYRVLYETAHAATAAGREAGMGLALLHTLRSMPADVARSPEVRHALQVRVVRDCAVWGAQRVARSCACAVPRLRVPGPTGTARVARRRAPRQVREAVLSHNYAAFFRLYATAPHCGRAILDHLASSMRWAALNAFVRACDPPVPVPPLAAMLGFVPQPSSQDGPASEQPGPLPQVAAGGAGGSGPLPGCRFSRLEGEAAPAATAEQGVAACADWLREHGAETCEKGEAPRHAIPSRHADKGLSIDMRTAPGGPHVTLGPAVSQAARLALCASGGELLLECKASRGKLFVPEEPAKVAHGDENLSVTDFLSRARLSLE